MSTDSFLTRIRLCYSEYMSKKAFAVILILSVVVTYLTQVIQAFMGGECSVFGGKCGFPLVFSSASFLDSPEIDYKLFLLDAIFWFIVIFGIWKIYLKVKIKV